MPTILVADDNSNIHKMVELALKDLGYKIEKVGNGEHAVRKLPDVKPDLILADIFMPVRNGYEVCEFVKTNEQYQHIPVVLLQGKFDPLDEHLMKKVRADGLLMKPFVPPDPLIKMVKTLLEESAATRAAIEAARAKPAASAEATVELTPSEVQELTGKAPEPEMPEYATAPPPVEIKEGDKTLAFGDLLGGGSSEEREAPKAAEPAGFQASSISHVEIEEPHAEVEEEAPAEEHWGGIKEELKQPTPDEPPIKVEFGEPEPMELVTEEQHATTPTVASSAPLSELATSPDEWMQSGPPKVEAPPSEEESWVAAPAAAAGPGAHEAAPPQAEISVEAPPPPVPIPEEKHEPIPGPMIEPHAEPAPLPYETPKLEPMPAPPAQMDAIPAAITPEPPPVVAAPPPPPAPVAAEPPPPPQPTRATMPIPMPIDLALVDAVVDKVMARLQPLILDQIRREVVRPLAEAMLRKELDK